MTPAATMPMPQSLPVAMPLAVRARAWLARLASISAFNRQRRALAALDDRLLADIGLTRAQAEAEQDRPIWDAPIWDAPRHWRG